MKIEGGYVTYCTNIHPGHNWSSHFSELQKHVPGIKERVSPDQKMGIGLRLSYQMAVDLQDNNARHEFMAWLEEQQLYVFVINGFPYGQFHETIIKDKVHTPDWTTNQRLKYTQQLFELMVEFLPDNMVEGGISTSPLSYRHWYPTNEDKNRAIAEATDHIIQVAEYLYHLRERTGKNLHLDVEPEPDGLLEDGADFIKWYKEILIPKALSSLSNKGLGQLEIIELIRNHIRLCYDVCHMAVEFEDQSDLVSQLRSSEIRIGRIQLSSALRLPPEVNPSLLQPFDESQYLHQVVIQESDGSLVKFPDLGEALLENRHLNEEWRIHFHVPLFTKSYGELDSTRDYIEEILAIHQETPLTKYFEVETYTWDVLPQDLQLPIGESISRELEYILSIVK